MTPQTRDLRNLQRLADKHDVALPKPLPAQITTLLTDRRPNQTPINDLAATLVADHHGDPDALAAAIAKAAAERAAIASSRDLAEAVERVATNTTIATARRLADDIVVAFDPVTAPILDRFNATAASLANVQPESLGKHPLATIAAYKEAEADWAVIAELIQVLTPYCYAAHGDFRDALTGLVLAPVGTFDTQTAATAFRFALAGRRIINPAMAPSSQAATFAPPQIASTTTSDPAFALALPSEFGERVTDLRLALTPSTYAAPADGSKRKQRLILF